MKISKITYSILVVGIFAGCHFTAFSQQKISDEKIKLIREFQTVTGIKDININIEFSLDNVRKGWIELFDKDPAFSDEQKKELNEFVNSASNRIAKQVNDSFESKYKISQLSGDAVLRVFDQNFTESELSEIIAFYKTSAGKKTLTFLPNVTKLIEKELSTIIVEKLAEFSEPLIKDEKFALELKIRELKAKK